MEAMSGEFEMAVLETVRQEKPFNGTLWLMLQVNSQTVLNNVKQLQKGKAGAGFGS